MNRIQKTLALSCLALALVGCESSTDKVDAGGVLLSISDFDGLPISVSASGGGGFATIGSLTIQNIAKNTSQPTSSLMNVELQSLEFTYTRDDAGTRVPPKLIDYGFGVIPVDGTIDINGQPFMRPDQFDAQPLRDLALLGRDTETNSTVVRMRVTMRAFGRTLSGDNVASAPVSFSIDVVP
ncbi:MAG: hypothetical protein AB7G12_00220 [Thermoanaerobaculia bacterium]